MGTGWRRAFCTTASRKSDAVAPDLDKQQAGYTLNSNPSPRSCVKLAFLSGGSNSSTPRTNYSPSLGCRTTDAENPVPTAEQIPTPRSATKSPRLSLKPRSNPSSPRLKLSLFRNSFKFRVRNRWKKMGYNFKKKEISNKINTLFLMITIFFAE